MDEPEFLKLATMSLETAFALERVLAGPRSPRTSGSSELAVDGVPQDSREPGLEAQRTVLLGRLLDVLDQGEEPHAETLRQ